MFFNLNLMLKIYNLIEFNNNNFSLFLSFFIYFIITFILIVVFDKKYHYYFLILLFFHHLIMNLKQEFFNVLFQKKCHVHYFSFKIIFNIKSLSFRLYCKIFNQFLNSF